MRRVSVDTNACVYFLNEIEPWQGCARRLFAKAGDGALLVELSAIVRLELLVKPYKERNAAEMRRVVRLMEETRGISVAPVTDAVITLAAQVRAASSFKTPDAIIIASAVLNRCDAVIGNDRRFAGLEELRGVPIIGRGGVRMSVPSYIHLDDYAKV